MRGFDQSLKSQKTVASMIERRDGEKVERKSVKIVEAKKEAPDSPGNENGLSEDVILANRKRLADKLKKKGPDSK